MLKMIRTMPSPWRGPYQVRHQLSPVICRVSKIDQSNETSVHWGRMKPYHQRSAFVDPDFEKINQMFLGAQLPINARSRKRSFTSMHWPPDSWKHSWPQAFKRLIFPVQCRIPSKVSRCRAEERWLVSSSLNSPLPWTHTFIPCENSGKFAPSQH